MIHYGRALPVIAVAVLQLAFVPPPTSAGMVRGGATARNHPTLSRPELTTAEPYLARRVHVIGNMEFPITNWGFFGVLWELPIDPKTGQYTWGHVLFSSRQSRSYLQFGSLWVGGLVETALGYDTLVSTGHDGFYPWESGESMTEFYPDSYSAGADILERSNDPNSPFHHPDAISLQDFTACYTDTLTDQAYVRPDPATWKPHYPLRIRVRQNSFVWPYEYGEDFVILQFWITNMRNTPLHKMRVGILVGPDAKGYKDEIVGCIRTAPTITGYGFDDTVMTAWSADNDGDPYRRRAWQEYSNRAVIGVRFVGTSLSPCKEYEDSLAHSFNWWAPNEDTRMDWGPQRRPGDRSISGGYGQPLGDAQKYRYMANREIDYGQHLANEDTTGWIKSPGEKSFGTGGAYNLADGADIRYLLSVGPFDLNPGDSIPIGIAVAGGDLLHRYLPNLHNLSKNPYEWYKNLDFADLGRNVQWAAWVYDNPGVDTDGDGCAGRYYLTNCVEIYPGFVICDTIYYAGDGVPDLRGPPPPPSPQISIHTEPGVVHIRWDGRESELYYDPFARRRDFEGYNVYGGLGHDPNTLNFMVSWDLVNYDRYRYIPQTRPSPWVLNEPPLTLKELYKIYGEDFNPTLYPSKLKYFEDAEGSRFYFKPHGGNRGNEYIESDRIMSNPIQYVRTDSVWDEAGQTWQRFGHYECTIDNLLPSQPHYFAVTAFDGGLPGGNLGPLESPPETNMQLAYPSYTPDYVAAHRLKVSVYPNPYKISERYRRRGFEDPNREGFLERERRIHFVNLPPEATIKIWSLDGDLIRELRHPESRFSDTPSHTAWDLITRNTQAVTSGIYLYTIESDWGTQAGKIVIIK